jgi:hypothetical protein
MAIAVKLAKEVRHAYPDDFFTSNSIIIFEQDLRIFGLSG